MWPFWWPYCGWCGPWPPDTAGAAGSGDPLATQQRCDPSSAQWTTAAQFNWADICIKYTDQVPFRRISTSSWDECVYCTFASWPIQILLCNTSNKGYAWLNKRVHLVKNSFFISLNAGSIHKNITDVCFCNHPLFNINTVYIFMRAKNAKFAEYWKSFLSSFRLLVKLIFKHCSVVTSQPCMLCTPGGNLFYRVGYLE